MSCPINLVQGDSGPQIRAIITREDSGNTVDLSQATTRLKIRKRGATDILLTLTAVDVDELLSDGVAIFAFSDGDLDLSPGSYEGEIEVTFDDSVIETIYETLAFYIREDF